MKIKSKLLLKLYETKFRNLKSLKKGTQKRFKKEASRGPQK